MHIFSIFGLIKFHKGIIGVHYVALWYYWVKTTHQNACLMSINEVQYVESIDHGMCRGKSFVIFTRILPHLCHTYSGPIFITEIGPGISAT